MAGTFQLRVINPIETLLEVSVARWVHLRLADGTGLSIYPGHAPLLAKTVRCQLRYTDVDGEHVYNVEAGILQVANDEVTILASGASEAETTPKPSAVSEEREFERLARELQARLEGETDSALAGVLTAGNG
jgi:F0F1-type ATP synthase epsilon subunit